MNFSGQMSDVGGSIIAESAIESQINGNSVVKQASNKFTSMILSLQINTPRFGWKWYLFSLACMIIQIWGTILLPTLNQSWGPIASLIFDILNVSNTFFVHYLNYDAALIVACICLGFVFLCIAVACICIWAITNATNHINKFKYLLFAFASIAQTFAIFLLFNFVGFYDCSITNINVDTLERTLSRFPSTSCFGNTIIIALCIAGSCALFVFVVLSRLLSHDLHPLSNSPFVSMTPKMMILLDVVNLLTMILLYTIPQSYVFVSNIINMIASMVLMIAHGRSCQFFKRIDNSLFMAILAARFGTSLGSFVNSLITSPLFDIPGSASYSLYVGASSTVVLAIICALVGFISIEIYTRIVIKLIRDMTLSDFLGLIHSNQPLNLHKSKKAIMGFMESKAQIYIQTLKMKNTLHQLSMFFRFANKSRQEIFSGIQADDGFDIYFTDKDISLIYLKILYNRKAREIDLLYNISTLMAYEHFEDDECHTPKALQVMSRVCKKANYWNHLDYHYRAKEFQQYASDTGTADASQENDAKMLLLKENQDKLLCLHRDFWKEMINEPVKLSSVQKICEKLSDISEDCEELFMEALSDRKNKAYLRMYATYVELFHFDKELAQAIHSEANQLDQEIKAVSKFKKKQIVPSGSRSSLKSMFKSRNKVRDSVRESADRMSDAGSDISTQIPNGFAEHFEHFDDSASVVADNNATESIEQKKDYLFRNALKARRQEGIKYSLYYLFLFCCFAIVTGGLVISIVNSTKIKQNIVNLKDVCIPETAPLSIVRNIRNIQNWIYVFFVKKYGWPSSVGNSPTATKEEYISYFKERLVADKDGLLKLIALGQNIQFDFETYTQYGKSMFQTYIPSSSKDGSNTTFDSRVYLGDPESRNVSVVEITNSIMKYLDLIKEEDFPLAELSKLQEMDLNSTAAQKIIASILSKPFMFPVSNYNFMYLWLNKFGVTYIYENFCNDYVERSKSSTFTLMAESEYYFIASICLMTVLGLLLVAYIQYDLLFFRRLIKLIEKEISKEGIGKIYQQLNKKTSMEASLDGNIVSKALHSNSSLVIAIALLSIFIPLCIGMLYLETYKNSKNALFTFTNVGLSTNVIEHLQFASFYLGEILTFFGVAHLSTNDVRLYNDKLKTGNFEEYYSLIRYESDILSANWNELIYGDVTKPDDDPVIGLYPSLDKILKQGVDNCTLYLQQNNLTLSLKTKVQYCTGLESVMTDFLNSAVQTTEDTRDFYVKQSNLFSINGTILDPTDIYMEHYALYVMSHPLNDKLLVFMNEFIRVSSELSLILLLIFTCLGFLMTAVIGRLVLVMIKNKSNQLYHTRMLMNYIPVEMLDRNEKLKNVALFNSFPNALVDKLARKGKDQKSDSGFNGVANIINSSVDGSALLNESGDIEIFNPAAHRMFGSTQVDILGTKLCSLFEETVQETIRKTFESVVEQSTKSFNSGGNGLAQETLEAECLRRNQTKFPAKICFFTTRLSDRGTIVVCTIKDVTSEKKQQALLAEEKKHSDNLLKNILPENVASRLKKGETFIAEKLNDITCFFSDMVGFTKISSTMQATELVKMLNAVVNGFDSLTELYDLEKIKTIGDAYFCVGGLHGSSDHPERMLKFAMSTFQVILDFNSGKFGVMLENDSQLDIRIGINTGAALAGVIGTKKFAYDLWGDTINTASRMESTGQPGRIQISRSTYERVYDMGLEFEEKRVEVKGKGIMQSYLLSARHHVSTKVEVFLEKSERDTPVDDIEQLNLHGDNNNSATSQNSTLE